MNNKGYIFCPVCREANDLSRDTCEYCGSKLKREPKMPDVIDGRESFRRAAVVYDSPKKRQIKLGSSAVFVVIVLLTVVYMLSKNGLFAGITKDSASFSKAVYSEASYADKGVPAVLTADELISSLRINPTNASDSYLGKYVTVTGRLLAVDSAGKFIAIVPVAEPYDSLSIICCINTEQTDIVSRLEESDIITVTGTVTEVSEDTGYYIDDNIIKIQK